MGRVVPLDKLKTKEERIEAQDKIEHYGRIYAWLENDENPLQTLKNQMDDLLQQLEKNDLSIEEKKQLLGSINSLSVMSQKIKEGTYKDELRNTITANIVKCKQFDAEEEKKTFLTVIKEVLSGNLNFIEYRKKQDLIGRVNKHGLVPDPKYSIEMQSPESIVKYIIANYDLVGIKMNESEQHLALVETYRPLEIEDEELIEELSAITKEVISSFSSSINDNAEDSKPSDNKKIDYERKRENPKDKSVANKGEIEQ